MPAPTSPGLLQVEGLQAAYEDVLLRLPTDVSLTVLCAKAEDFVKLEATLPAGPEDVARPGNVWPLVESWRLGDFTYRVVATVRCAGERDDACCRSGSYQHGLTCGSTSQLHGLSTLLSEFITNLLELAPRHMYA